MKAKIYSICLTSLLFGTCFGMSGEVGQQVIDEMRTALKEPCLDLLASSELIDFDTFEKRVQVVKNAVTDFEAKINRQKDLSAQALPGTAQSTESPSAPDATAIPMSTPMPAAPESTAAATQPTSTPENLKPTEPSVAQVSVQLSTPATQMSTTPVPQEAAAAPVAEAPKTEVPQISTPPAPATPDIPAAQSVQVSEPAPTPEPLPVESAPMPAPTADPEASSIALQPAQVEVPASATQPQEQPSIAMPTQASQAEQAPVNPSTLTPEAVKPEESSGMVSEPQVVPESLPAEPIPVTNQTQESPAPEMPVSTPEPMGTSDFTPTPQ